MTTKYNKYFIASIILAFNSTVWASFDDAIDSADSVFFGNNIITMEDDDSPVDAIAIKGSKIIFSGKRAQAKAYISKSTIIVELGDKALLPGFIDAHGHFTGTARFINFANLSSPPVGTVQNIDDLISQLKGFVAAQTQTPSWIIGYGYDESLLAEKRHPTRADLDKVSSEIPITIIHVSHHFTSVNSRALQTLNINAESKDPKGGVIRRIAGSKQPNGVLEETAAYPAYYPLSKISPDEFEQALRKSADYYASFGITTAQDGAASSNDINFLRTISANKRLPIDISLYQRIATPKQITAARTEQDYRNGIKVAGAKFSLDGSPQGRTAWLTKPYLKNGTNHALDYIAYPTIDPDFYQSAIKTLLKNKVQFITHANGDAAIDLMLNSLELAVKESASTDHRSVIIHAQLMREDQIKQAKTLDAIPSFFSAHPFFWGDWHRLNFGDKRAQNISPLAWAEKTDLRFTIHNDSPIVPPNMMRLLWVSTNRLTRSGKVLGPEQRVSVETALRAITIDAAYQNFEEDTKGSLRAGKQADMVILSENPLNVDKTQLHKLTVLKTIARGKIIFSAP